MDLADFGLTRRPFRPTPDTDAYFPAPAHEAALAGLRHAFAARDGLALIDGEPGTGKTLVALKFLESLDAGVPRVLIPAPRFARPADLFQAILFDLGAEYRGLSEQELRLAVTEQLLKQLAKADPTVIVLDEAQHLGADLLEEVRLLGNIETRSAKAAFVVLVAQRVLRARVGRPELAAFAQRVAVRAGLDPLSRDDAARYVAHHVEAAGGPPDLFTDEAVALLAERCRGVPRLLNQAAGQALALAESASVDAEAVTEALAQLGLAAEEPAILPHPAKPRGRAKRKSA